MTVTIYNDDGEVVNVYKNVREIEQAPTFYIFHYKSGRYTTVSDKYFLDVTAKEL